MQSLCYVILLCLTFSTCTGIGDFTFIMLPGQSFTATPCNGCPADNSETFYVGEWGSSKRCVVKTEKSPDQGMPFAWLTMTAPNTTCPVGSVFDITLATADRQRPWNPFPVGSSRPPKQVMFVAAAGHELDPDCLNDTLAVLNRNQMNTQLFSLQPGDTYTVPPGIHCLAAGVYARRLSHVVLDIQGDMFFNQDIQHWSNSSQTGKFLNGILLQGLTNVTITSSTQTGRIRSNGCKHWYVQRLRGAQGPPPLLEVGADPVSPDT